jgi:hypothetical protein
MEAIMAVPLVIGEALESSYWKALSVLGCAEFSFSWRRLEEALSLL